MVVQIIQNVSGLAGKSQSKYDQGELASEEAKW